MNAPARISVIAAAQAALVAFVFACGVFPLTDTDVWWHLSAGRWMWEHGAIPRVDPFCFSSWGRPWLDAQWGFQLLLYGLWNLGGAQSLVLAKAGAFAAIFVLALARGWTARSAPFLLAIGTFAAFHARLLADVRPVWGTVLLLALQYRLLRDHFDGRLRLPWAALAASQLLLVQMQGLYWLGPAQYAVMWLGSGMPRKKPLLFLGGALLAAGFVNPYGWRGALFPLGLFARILPVGGNLFSREVAENIPFWRWLSENPHEAIPFVGMAVGAAGLLAWTRARAARGEAGLLLLYGALGVLAQRNLIFFVLAFLWVVARAVPALTANVQVSGARFRAAAIFAGVWGLASLAGYAADLREARRWELPGSWETPFRFPAGAVAYLQAHPLQGPVFNEMRHGGYLGWKLWPGVHPFLDGRMILHDAAFMREFLDLFDHPERFEAYRRRYGIEIVVLPIGEDDRYLGLAAALAGDSAWSLLYCDGAEVLLARKDAWRGHDAPEPWTPGVGAAAAERRFRANPALVARARQRIVLLEDRAALTASPGSRTLAGPLFAAERETQARFPDLAASSVSLSDSLKAYATALEAGGFRTLPDSLRAEVLARFLFGTVGLRSVDTGDDLGLSLPSRVLRDREGSCVGLSLLLIALAERVGVEARPVFLPGHVFVRLESGPASWRNVELLRGGILRSDAFYAEAFRLGKGQAPVSGEPLQALAPLFFNRGNAARAAGRSGEALEDYRRALRLRPGFPEAQRAEAAYKNAFSE